MSLARLWLVPILLVWSSLCFAQQPRTEGVLVKVGDTYDKVKVAYQTTVEPEAQTGTGAFVNKGSTSLRLRTKGVWFFFDKSEKIYTIRLDAPFTGAVGGVKIGDSARTLTKVLGKPAKEPPSLPGMVTPRTLVYYLDDSATTTFWVSVDDQVETIFISK